MSSYDWSQFHVHMYYAAPLTEVFRRFSTGAGLASFFIYEARHQSSDGHVRTPDEMVQAGDEYHWTYVHDFGHSGHFIEVVPEQMLSFSFGDMRVAVSFREEGGLTEVDLHQTGCATEDPERAWQHLNCRSCWIYFLTNLRSVIVGGPDLRDFDHPNWNDSVSIGFVPGTVPGNPRPRS